MKGLRFFQKTNTPRAWVLASFHSPHSLTWRWGLWLHFAPTTLLPRVSGHRNNGRLLQWWAAIPFLGTLDFHQQQPMWYRDLYMRLRDERDQMEGMLWLPEGHPHKVHRPAPPPPAPTAQGSATVQ